MQEVIRLSPLPSSQQLDSVLTAPQARWRARWLSISRVQLAGPVRSFLFKLMHRRLPLLSNPWLASFYNRDNKCMMCTSQAPETYSHLFSDCTLAAQMWKVIQPLATLLLPLLTPQLDPRPARLIGDIQEADVSRLLSAWPPLPGVKPTSERISAWVRITWNEVRAAILYPIWITRCEVLAGSCPPDTASQRALQQSQHLLRTLAYIKLPSLLPRTHHPPTSPHLSHYHHLTWGKVAHLLLLPHHNPNFASA